MSLLYDFIFYISVSLKFVFLESIFSSLSFVYIIILCLLFLQKKNSTKLYVKVCVYGQKIPRFWFWYFALIYGCIQIYQIYKFRIQFFFLGITIAFKAVNRSCWKRFRETYTCCFMLYNLLGVSVLLYKTFFKTIVAIWKFFKGPSFSKCWMLHGYYMEKRIYPFCWTKNSIRKFHLTKTSAKEKK